MLPPATVVKLCDTTREGVLRGFQNVFLAFRHGSLFAYATNGRGLVRVRVDTTEDEELKSIEEMVFSTGADISKASIAMHASTFKELVKKGQPCSLLRVDKSWYLRKYDGTMFSVMFDPCCTRVRMFEDFIANEAGAPLLGTFSFNPSLIEACNGAIGNDGDVATIEIANADNRPMMLRNGQNIGMVMPCRSKEGRTPGLDALLEAAQAALNDPLALRDLPRKIIQTLSESGS